MTWEFRLLPGKFRLLPGKFRLSLLHVFAYVSCFSCISVFSCGFHVLHVFMCVYQIARYHVHICNFPCKKDPHKSGWTCLKCRCWRGKPDLWGSFFAGQSKWKISSSYIYLYIVSCCVRSIFHSELSCLHVFHGLSCLNLLNAYNLCFGSWFGVCGGFSYMLSVSVSLLSRLSYVLST